jgi:ADP-ribose pyrophosphatase YjhB (NUDIX family)
MMWRPAQLLLWPALLVYFLTLGRRRTRVLIASGSEILLVQDAISLVSDRSTWSLPGGGIARGESPEQSAARELQEELGITVEATSLKLLGTERTADRGIGYKAWFYTVSLPSNTELKLRRHEVKAAAWFDRKELAQQKMSPAVQQALTLFDQQ